MAAASAWSPIASSAPTAATAAGPGGPSPSPTLAAASAVTMSCSSIMMLHHTPSCESFRSCTLSPTLMAEEYEPVTSFEDLDNWLKENCGDIIDEIRVPADCMAALRKSASPTSAVSTVSEDPASPPTPINPEPRLKQRMEQIMRNDPSAWEILEDATGQPTLLLNIKNGRQVPLHV